MRAAAALSLVACSMLFARPATAHEIRPAIVTASFLPDETFDITVVANLEALLADIGPAHSDSNESPQAAVYNQLRALPAEELRGRFAQFAARWLAGVHVEFDDSRIAAHIAAVDVPPTGDTALARLSTIRLSGDIPRGAREFRWRYAGDFGSNVLRVKRAGSDEMVTSWLKDGAMSAPIPLTGAAPKSTAQIFLEYVVLGFTHIVPYGLDHILFVLGLYLLNTRAKALLVQVTAFTVAHSITLGLGLYGVVTVSPSIVEPLIALSIVYVAVENLVTNKLHVWRPFVVFGFGLLHGLGFAGVLHEIGLPRADYVTGLIAFNVGVELGQLAVIAVAFAVSGLWFRTRPWYRTRIVQPASAAIALVGLFWTIERVVDAYA
jgi:hypothetical protein